MINIIKPDQYYVSVLDIRPQSLCDRGYKAVLLDLDNTLQPRGDDNIPEAISEWVNSLKTAGLSVALISNSEHERAVIAAQELNVLLIRKAFKPLSSGYVQACACLGVACRDAVMIGDQTYTDVLGAHRVGMEAILVMPQNTHDPLHTYLFRILDSIAVHDMRAIGSKR